MNVRHVLAVAVAGGLLMLAAPAANALCVSCDGTGCHVSTGSCDTGGTPETQKKQHAKHGGRGRGGGAGDGATRDGVGYVGGCGITTFNDTTPDGTFGGQRVWNGEVDIDVAAATPGSVITKADCYIKVTASGSETMVLSAVPGGPTAAAAGQATFTADVTDYVYVCTHVATSSSAETDDCAGLVTTPVCPDQACGPGGVLDQVDAVVDSLAGPLTCGVLVTLAPTVDSLPTAGVVYIDPATGDTFVDGSTLHYDCPPYLS